MTRWLILFLLTALVSQGAEEKPFAIRRWLAAIDLGGTNNSARLPLGMPVYVSSSNFVAKYQSPWFMASGVDLMTFAPLQIHLGESTGTDDYATTHLTGRSVELFAIPTNQPGLYWRVRAEKGAPPVTLDCAFVYDFSETNKNGKIRGRKISFHDKLHLTNDMVALVRLPTLNYEKMVPRSILGVSVGQQAKLETREFYMAVSLTNVPVSFGFPK